MNLSIPFNGQSDLLKKVNKEKVVEVYGKLTRDLIGGGRPSCANPFVSKNSLTSCIKQAHSYGIKFNYLLNATCMGNLEWTRWWQKRIRNFLDWLTKIEVDSITVAIPYLAELITKSYPHFKLTVSSLAQVDSVRRAKEWEDLGVDEITLFDVNVNRNFPLIRAIRKNVKCRLRVIANQDTILHCASYSYHVNASSHASEKASTNFYIEYCRIGCRLKKLLNPLYFIRQTWIRPEDVHYYEEVGANRLKLVDRSMITAAIVNIVDAYTKNSYDGNLLDLMAHPSINLLFNKSKFINKVKYFFKPFYINLFKLYKAKGIISDFDVYIDNRALEGLIMPFLTENCELKFCDSCGYCEQFAKKAIKINPAYREKIYLSHGVFLDKLISGDIFRY